MTGREQMKRDLPMILETAEAIGVGQRFTLADIYGDRWETQEDNRGIDHAFASAIRSGEIQGFKRVLKEGQGERQASFPNLYERTQSK